MDFVTNNWHLVALAFVSGAMLLWPMGRQASAGGTTLSTLQATHLINREDAVVVDLRDAAEFGKGHILGARNVPQAELERRAAELAKYKAKPVILSGGYGAWQQAGLPTEK